MKASVPAEEPLKTIQWCGRVRGEAQRKGHYGTCMGMGMLNRGEAFQSTHPTTDSPLTHTLQFWDRVSLCSPGSPQIHSPLTSAPCMAEIACIAMLGEFISLCCSVIPSCIIYSGHVSYM